MASSLGGNTRIPKRNRSELMEFIRLDSPDAKEILRESQRTNLVEKNTERIYRTISMCLVRNTELARRYERRRKALRDQGRKPKELEDRLLFAEDSWQGIQKICRSGPNCEKARNVLGDSQFGLHLSRNYDVLLRYTACANADGIRFLLVFKAMFGKVKSVTPNLTNDQCSIEPTPNYDTHISVTKPDADMGICDAQDNNFAYLYEYDEETTLPSMSPSQILPFAVISLERTAEKIIGPLRTPWPKLRKKRQSSFNPTLKQQISEETHSPPVSNMEVPSKANLTSTALTGKVDTSMEITDNCAKKDSIKKETLFLNDIPTSISNGKQKLRLGTARRSARTVIGKRTKSVGGNENMQHDYEEETDLQYTEYLWDPFLEPRSSDNTNVYMESEVSPQSQKEKSPENQDGKSLQNQNGSLHDTETTSDKTLIIQRLKEIEKEIHTKQKKLRELRLSRSTSMRSGDSITSEEGSWVDDVVSDNITLSPKRVESCDDRNQPLDLSKACTITYKKENKDAKTMSTKIVNNQSQGNDSIIDPENRNQQSAYAEASREQKEMSQLRTSIIESEAHNSAEEKGKLQLKLTIGSDNRNCDPDRDTPTPTLDEPQDMYWMHTELPDSQCSSNRCNGAAKESTEVKEFYTGAKENIQKHNLVPVNGQGPEYDTNRYRIDESMQSSSKKCSSFYESYIRKKKQTMGDRFKLDEKPDISIDISRHDLTSKSDVIMASLSDNVNTDMNPVSVEKPSVSEMDDQQVKRELSSNTTCLSSQLSLLPFPNNCMTLNRRDPRAQKRSTLDTESNHDNVSVPQTNDKDIAQVSNKNEASVTKDDHGDDPEYHQDKSDSTNPIKLMSDKVDCSEAQHESDSDSKHSILACSTSDTHSSSSCDENSIPHSNVMQVDTEAKSRQSPSRNHGDKAIDPVTVSNTPSKNLSSEVEKVLQGLGNAIKVIQKKVAESDDNKSSSGTNSQSDEEMEVDKSQIATITHEDQQAISTIVTDRVVRQKNDSATMKTPTVIEVTCINMQKDIVEKRAVHDFDSSVENIKKVSDLDIASHDAIMTTEQTVESSITPNTHNKNEPILNISGVDIDTSENLTPDDSTPKHQGSSSYMPDDRLNPGCYMSDACSKSGCEMVSKTFSRDVEAIKDSKPITEPQSAASSVKIEVTEYGFDEKVTQMDKNVDKTPQEEPIANNDLDNDRTTQTGSSDWTLSQEIEKTLAEIKNESCVLYQSYSLVKEKSFQGKGTETITHQLDRSMSEQRHSSDINRSRSKSVTGSAASDSHKQHEYRPREVSPIRDPSFVPFHQKGKILSEYFKGRHKRLGLKWVDRRRSPSGFRKRAIQKAKITLYKNCSSKGQSDRTQTETTRVVKAEKKDFDDDDRSSWKTNHPYSKPYIRNFSRNVTERKFQERGVSSRSSRHTETPWHRTGTVHPDNLIIDRHGMIISLDSPSDRSRSRPRSDSRSDSRMRDDSVFHRRQSRRSFEGRREVTSHTDPPSSEATLSRAMTSLLKRILFDGPRNDGSTEGKMADMVFEMVKKKVSAGDQDKAYTLDNENTNLNNTQGVNDLPVDNLPDLVTPDRPDHSKDRSKRQERYSNNWERREVYVDRKQSSSCDNRKYFDQRRGSSQTGEQRESRGDRHYDRSENRFDRNVRNDSTDHFEDRFVGRGRGWSRGRGRWNSPRGNFNKPYTRSNFNNDYNKQPFQRKAERYPSRSFNSNASRLKTGSDFSSRRYFDRPGFNNKPYDRKFDKYSFDRKSLPRDRIKESSRN
ncbi:uncharacterized protein LOC117336308 [Pecten maximus]|uniref:uncharacterized protein LOC117336308 n=1 Tax=Pecten maximus TaxID=6579 RepID=UPI001458F686|nr:uncharacterized protein LOC117336308 [Pecten maximus]